MSGQLEVVVASGMLGVEMLESSRSKIVASTTKIPVASPGLILNLC
jgi:hypothetical protein